MSQSPIHPRRRTSRRRLLGPRCPDVAVLDEAPLAELRIYESLILLTRKQGAHWRQYPVSADEIAQLLGKVPSVSGLLPPHTLGTGMLRGAPFYVVYVPAHQARLQTSTEIYDIPLPPLIWCGHKRDYRVWALATDAYPARDLPLCRAPFPNCYENGGICWGNVGAVAEASPKTLATVRKLFLEESAFNLHIAGGKSVAFPVSVIAMWKQLGETGAESYPLDDLMPAECSLFWALSGGPWRGGR